MGRGKNRLFDSRYVPIVLVILAGAVVLRMMCFRNASADYTNFLRIWVEEFRNNGGFRNLGTTVSNYNLVYLYFLAAFSYIPLNDMYLIKLLSVLFDFVIAFALAGFAHRVTGKQSVTIIALTLALFWPTFWLNSAFWAQCDAIYAGLCLLSFAAAIKDKPVLSVVLASVAFSFKLQAVFFLPVFLIFLIGGKVKLRHALIFPLTYIVLALPGLAMGWPLERLITVYTHQVNLYSDYLTLNAPSMFALFPKLPKHPYFEFGLIAAVMFVVILLAAAFRLRGRLEEKHYAAFAFAFCIGLPWLLPAMHERYFYAAEVFALLYVIYEHKRWYYAPLTLYASISGYYAFLVLGTLSQDLWLAACFMAYPMLRVCIDIYNYRNPTVQRNVSLT